MIKPISAPELKCAFAAFSQLFAFLFHPLTPILSPKSLVRQKRFSPEETQLFHRQKTEETKVSPVP